MTLKRAAIAGLFLLFGLSAWPQAGSDGNDKDFADRVYHRAREIKPPAEKRKWEEIPWLTDLVEAVRVAKAEGRPLLLWGSDDPPLLRC